MKSAASILRQPGLSGSLCVMVLAFTLWGCGEARFSTGNLGNLELPSGRLTAPPRVRLVFKSDRAGLAEECMEIFHSSALFSLVEPELKSPQLDVLVQADLERRTSFLGTALALLTLGALPAKRGSDRTEINAELQIPSYSKSESIYLFQGVDLWTGWIFLPITVEEATEQEVSDRLCGALSWHAHQVYESFLSEAWSLTQSAADIESYERFVDTYPGSTFSKEASNWLEEVLWKIASSDGNPKAYVRYLERFPSGRFAAHVEGLRAEREGRDWEAAKRGNTAEAYRQFLVNHPESRHKEDLDELARRFKACTTIECSEYVFGLWDDANWKRSQAIGSRSEYKEYLLSFPRGKYASQAVEAIDEIDWRACEGTSQGDTCQRYLSEHRRGRYQTEAKQKIVSNEFLLAEQLGTIEAYETFVKSHRSHETALARLRELRYAKAVESGNLEDWISFRDKSRVSSSKLRKWDRPTRLSYKRTMKNAAEEIERLLYERIVAQPSLEESGDYLKRFPDGPHKQQVLVLREPLLLEEVRSSNTVTAYERYLEEYPTRYSSEAVRSLMETAMWREARNENDHPSYEGYLEQYPNGPHAVEAREKLSWMKDNAAIPKISYPEQVVSRGSARFRWVTRFSEESGRAGYYVSGSGWIIDRNGGRWGPGGRIGSRGKVTVKPGRSAQDDYWVSESFCGGRLEYRWKGEDTHGHSIDLMETVKLVCND